MTQIIECPNCTQKNRVPDLAAHQSALCGICKEPLVSSTDDEDEDDDEETL